MENFKETHRNNEAEIEKKAQLIYKNFIPHNAQSTINIDGDTRAVIKKRMDVRYI